MSSSHTVLDPNKILDSEVIRTNLMLCSLYLSAYEILKTRIVEGVAGFLVFLPEPQEMERVESEGIQTVPGFDSHYREQTQMYNALVEEYEQALGIRHEQRGWRGLIPSCRWLHGQGVLSEQDVESVRQIRLHRNEIAHELPNLLISEGANVDLGHLQQIILIVKKTDPFLAQISADVAPDIPDEDMMSFGTVILGVIWDAVREYLQRLKA